MPFRSISDPPIEVLFASTSYPRDNLDWRGLFIRSICTALARREDLSISLWAPPGLPIENIKSVTSKREIRWLENLMNSGGISHKLRTNPLFGIASASRLIWALGSAYRREKGVSIYHINWLQSAIPLPNDGKPALITVLGNDMHLLKAPFMRHAVRRALRFRNATLCPNADWMVPTLQDAFGDIASVEPVPFGIACDWYETKRNPAPESIWLVVSRLTKAKLGPLFDWCEPMFHNKKRQLHLFGPMQENIQIPEWVQYHGPATAETLSTAWFPRAQGLITLSQHAEGRPQVMLEAMASRLPIIASRIPAHEDLIENNVSGLLCTEKKDFQNAIEELEMAENNQLYGTAAQTLAKQKFGTWDDCAQRYISIYHKLLEK